jgi:hypothetical protein
MGPAVRKPLPRSPVADRTASAAAFAGFPLNGFVDFLAVDGNLTRRLNAKADFVTTNIDNRNDDVVGNNNRLVSLTG